MSSQFHAARPIFLFAVNCLPAPLPTVDASGRTEYVRYNIFVQLDCLLQLSNPDAPSRCGQSAEMNRRQDLYSLSCQIKYVDKTNARPHKDQIIPALFFSLPLDDLQKFSL